MEIERSPSAVDDNDEVCVKKITLVRDSAPLLAQVCNAFYFYIDEYYWLICYMFTNPVESCTGRFELSTPFRRVWVENGEKAPISQLKLWRRGAWTLHILAELSEGTWIDPGKYMDELCTESVCSQRQTLVLTAFHWIGDSGDLKIRDGLWDQT